MKRAIIVMVFFVAFFVPAISNAAYAWFSVSVVSLAPSDDTNFSVWVTDTGGSFTNRKFSFPTSFSQAGKNVFIATLLTAISNGQSVQMYLEPSYVNSIYGVRLYR